MATMDQSFPGVVYGEEVAKIEPYGVEVVPEAERHGHPRSLFWLWLGVNMSMSTWVTGAVATTLFGLPLWLAWLALLAGAALGAAVVALHSLFGPRLGVSQMIHSRAAFGALGNVGPAVLSAIMIVGFYTVNAILGAFALDSLLHIGYVPALAILVAAQTLLAIYGHNMVHQFEKVMAIILGVLFLIIGAYAVGRINLAAPGNPAAPLAGLGPFAAFLGSMGAALSFTITYSVLASDYTRYLPRTTKSGRLFASVFLGNFAGGGLLFMIGAAVGSLALVGPDEPPTSMMLALVPAYFGIPAMVAVVLGSTTQNVLAAYSAGLVALVARIPTKRWLAALGAGALGFIPAVLGQGSFAQKYESFLLVILYWALPWMGVVLADYFVVHRGEYRTSLFFDLSHRFGRGLIAWLVGIAATIPFIQQQLFVGPVAQAFPSLGDISYYVGILVAFVIYAVIGDRRGQHRPLEKG
ncbi:MAG: cytosine permease [Chloroflexi bacterium]|nr:cytosine permease [Chloroflexota bacterium]